MWFRIYCEIYGCNKRQWFCTANCTIWIYFVSRSVIHINRDTWKKNDINRVWIAATAQPRNPLTYLWLKCVYGFFFSINGSLFIIYYGTSTSMLMQSGCPENLSTEESSTLCRKASRRMCCVFIIILVSVLTDQSQYAICCQCKHITDNL